MKSLYSTFLFLDLLFGIVLVILISVQKSMGDGGLGSKSTNPFAEGVSVTFVPPIVKFTRVVICIFVVSCVMTLYFNKKGADNKDNSLIEGMMKDDNVPVD